MTDAVPGFPSELASVDLAESRVSMNADASVYPLQAVYGAAYVFLDRCYVFIDRPDASHYRVTLSPKAGANDGAALRTWVGEFANELLSCAWRQQITQENRALIEAVTTQALAGAMGPPSLDDLEKFDFSEENFEDPLGIAMSWEEKYKKKAPAEPAPEAASARADEKKEES